MMMYRRHRRGMGQPASGCSTDWTSAPEFQMENCGALPMPMWADCAARNQARSVAMENLRVQYQGCIPEGSTVSNFDPNAFTAASGILSGTVNAAAEQALAPLAVVNGEVQAPIRDTSAQLIAEPATAPTSAPARTSAAGTQARTPASSPTVVTTRAPSSAPGAPDSGSGTTGDGTAAGSGTTGDGTAATSKPVGAWLTDEMISGIPNWGLLLGALGIGYVAWSASHGR